jgi:hypothetical protein
MPYYPAYGAYPNYTGYNYPGYDQNYAPQMMAHPAMPMGMAGGDGSLPDSPSVPFAGPVPGMPVPPVGDDDDWDKRDSEDHAFHRASHEKFWGSVDYTMSWFRPMRVNGPLATIGSPADPRPAVLGQPGTVAVFGNDAIDFGMFSGMQVGFGVFLDGDDHWSLDWAAMYAFPNHVRFTLASDGTGNPVIGRPVFNVVEGREAAFVDSLPGVTTGGFSADARSELISTEANLRNYCCLDKHTRADVLVGFRYLRLEESLSMEDQFAPLGPGTLSFVGTPVSPPATLSDVDRFQMVNSFYGLQLGGRLTWESEWVNLSVFAKAGLGATDQRVDITGATSLFTETGTQTAPGGVLALPSNIGTHTRTVLGFIAEGGATVGVNLTKHLEMNVGYSFLFWNHVVRPGAQINRNVNPSLVPSDSSFGMVSGPAQPVFGFNEEQFWVHTITIGFEFHY